MKALFVIFIQFLSCIIIHSQVIFIENFESDSTRNRWEHEYEVENAKWKLDQTGGHDGFPEEAKSGQYNALFHYLSTNNEIARIISPSLDFISIERYKLELRFWHAQDDFLGNTDNMYVYYKVHEDSSWILLKSYLDPQETWVERRVLLPDSIYTDNFYFAFEGRNNRGHGVCLDSIVVIETGIEKRYIDTIIAVNASSDFVATETKDNPVMKLHFIVQGNDEELVIDSLVVQSLNTSDLDIELNGIKLYYTNEDKFSKSNLVASALSFTNNIVIFNNIYVSLPTGSSYLWITYDIDSFAAYGNKIDCMIPANSIKINNQYYPQSNLSPTGSRIIYETIFFDDFETIKGWTLKPEFEIGMPLGKSGLYGNPDPSQAYSGDCVLGTDLSSNGIYESNLGDTAYLAITPSINCKYYKNINLTFQRWLNIEVTDRAKLGYILNNQLTQLWQNSFITENFWNRIQFDLSGDNLRKNNVRFYYSLGPTNTFSNYTGWNIDDFILTGDFISNDIGVSEWISPVDGCVNTDISSVAVKVTNYGGAPTDDTIRIYYSFDGGYTKIYDTIFGSLPIEGDTIFTFSTQCDLSGGGFFNARAATILTGDEFSANNKKDTSLIIIPSYNLPYFQNFEQGESFWLCYGENNSWELGKPSSVNINSAASGTKSWITSKYGFYNSDEESYVESPCFNFSGFEHPIFEFKTFRQIDSSDGVWLMYSLDGGVDWNEISNIGEAFDDWWNWYTDTSLAGTAYDGWADTTSQWVTSKKLLPDTLANQSCVRFRVIFKSDSVNNAEGFAFDDVKIYEAPPDIGVISIFSPVSACELSENENIKIRIKNFGLDTLNTGYEFLTGLKVNNSLIKTDTINLTANLLPGDSIEHTFSETVDFGHSGLYNLKAYTILEQDINFYDTINNDTAYADILIYGMPEYTLGPDFGTGQPDTVVLDAGSGYTTYRWMDGLGVKDTFGLDTAGIYWVEVTNDSGCVAYDTIEIILSDADLSVISVLNLDSACGFPDTTYLEVMIHNYGPDSLFIGDTTLIGYRINQGTLEIDTIILTDSLLSDSSINYIYKKPADFSNPGTYSIEFFTAYYGDIDLSNDTLNCTIEVFGYPDVDLVDDTIYTTRPDTLEFDAGAGFATYLWQDNSTDQVYNVTDSTSKFYKVTVTDIHACGVDRDSSMVIAYNQGITSIVEPVSSCELSDTERIIIRVKNYGHDVYPAGDTIKLNIKVNNGQDIPVKYELTSDFEYNDSIDVIVDSLFDFHTPGNYQVFAELLPIWDADTLNNVTSSTVRVWGYPEFDLGPDTIFTNAPTSVELTTVPGYDYYLWQDSSTEENYKVTEPSSQLYFVTVSDLHSCSANDTLQIISYDIGISGLENPMNSCELSDNEEISVIFTNNCYDTLPEGDSIKLALIFEDSTIIEETHILEDTLYPDASMFHTFNPLFDLSNPGRYHYIIYLVSAIDVMPNNDTLEGTVNVWGYPDVELGLDTIFTTQADTLEFDPGSGFKTYEWQDGTFGQIYDVSSLNSAIYKVTVTDFHHCGNDVDSVVVLTYNIQTDILILPLTSCELSDSEEIVVSIKNLGTDSIISGETIYISCSVDEEAPVSESFNLTETLQPDDTILYSFIPKFDFSDEKDYIIRALAYINNDVVKEDSLIDTITVHGYPEIELGNDISTLQPDTVTINAGGSYYSYTWNEGTTGPVLNVTKLNSFLYKVTVSNDFQCETIDSISINATDMSLDEITQPVDTCIYYENQQIEVKIINACHDTIFPGETIYLFYRFDTSQLYIDTLILDIELYPGDSVIILSQNNYDMQQQGIYPVSIYINYEADINQGNDTLLKDIEIFGNPEVDLGPEIIYTARADTITLNAGSGFKEYLWQDGSVLSSFPINILDSATYSVTVTDGNNCIAYDEVIIMSYNIGIQSIVAPESQCELSNAENLSVEIINSGNSSIFDGDSIIFNYELNGIPISEKLILSNDLLPSEMLEYEFIQNMDMSSYGNYDLVVFISKDYDNDRANDSTLKNIVVFGNPLIDIGPGVIYTGRADTISLDAGSGYEQYLWQDGSTLSTYQINNLDSALYSVTVTNEYNCSTYDEITIMSYNIGIQSVNVPESNCELSNAEEASLEIVNKGNTGIYAGDSLIFNYIINEEPVQEKIILDKDFLPDETLEYSFVRKMDMSIHGEYNLEIYLSKDFDNNLQDDTVKNIIEVYGYPVIDLGEDTIYTAKADTIEFILNDQYDTYLWQDGSTNSYYSVTDLASSKYSVTVTNDKNCITEDEIIVMSYDLDLQSVDFPESDCELSKSEEISLVILNASNTSILPGDYVIVDYHIKELHNSKKIVFTDTLKPSENYNYTINEKIDMSGIGIYNMIVSIEKEYDYNDKNNSMSEKVEVYGYPEVSLGGDTEDKLYVTLPYRLTPDGDFITYLWHDGTTDEEYKIRYEGWVKVTVTDENNCPGSDSVYIMINTDDINELSKDICAYQVFPNPVNKNLYIKFPAQADSEFIIEIIDITGNVTYTNKYVLNRNENNLINIGVSEFPSGLYILRIISLNSQKVYKVILQ